MLGWMLSAPLTLSFAASYWDREGEGARCVYLVMSGVVELVTALAKGDAAHCGATSANMEMAASMQVDLDDSLTLDCSGVVGVTVAAEACEDGTLHIDRHMVSFAVTSTSVLAG